jgi:DNA-binding NtrC family response regulator
MMPSAPRGKTPPVRVEIPTRVLVVDDESLIRWSICTALAAEGFDPVPAADPADAQRILGQWPPPRVAILDRRYSNGDAHDLRALIRTVYPDCRFLIMTTAEGGMSNGGSASGRVEVVEKPFDLARIVQLVGELAAA